MYVSLVLAVRTHLATVTDGVNVLPVRSRTTRSSKGKASLIFFSFSFDPSS
jgi:hypothetical protein